MNFELSVQRTEKYLLELSGLTQIIILNKLGSSTKLYSSHKLKEKEEWEDNLSGKKVKIRMNSYEND